MNSDSNPFCPDTARSFIAGFNRGDTCILWMSTFDIRPKLINAWYNRLPSEEKQRADSFRFHDDRSEYVAAHILLRKSISLLTQQTQKDAPIFRDSSGKPRVKTEDTKKNIEISLTHTRGMVMIAICSDGEVGIDVENSKRLVTDEIRRFLCSEDEYLELSLLPGEKENRYCIDLWTMKESLVKSTGQGLRAKFSSMSCALLPPRLLIAGDLLGSRDEWIVFRGSLPGHFSWAAAKRAERAHIMLLQVIPPL